jgi:hypothetical protein
MDAKDMFMTATQYDLSELPPVQLVDFKPVVTRLQGLTFDDSVVHHMDVFLCTEELAQFDLSRQDVPGMEGTGGGVPCDGLAFAYDRDGKALTLPDHVGIAVGKGTPYSRIAIEWHYLLGRKGTNDLNFKDHFTDHSGIVFTVTPDIRQHNAAVFGWIDGDMKLPPGKARYKHTITTSAGKLDQVLEKDLQKYGEVHPVAVHLHMHNHGRAAWIDHIRQGLKLGEFGRIDKYKGYGTDQSFFAINSVKPQESEVMDSRMAKKGHFSWKPSKDGIKAGDALSMSCVFDTRCRYATHTHGGTTVLEDDDCEKARRPIRYGLSHSQEMCGALMMYYPHDATSRFYSGDVLGYKYHDLVVHGHVEEEQASTEVSQNAVEDAVVPETEKPELNN